MDEKETNIYVILEDNNILELPDNNEVLTNILNDFEKSTFFKVSGNNDNMDINMNMDLFFMDESFYQKNHTIKDLLKICEYYNIDKNIKLCKYKKNDIINSILYFESLSENFDLVETRCKMWKYMNELLNDTKMKKYIIWN